MQFYRKNYCCINYLLYLCSARGATVVARLRGRLVLKPSLIKGWMAFRKRMAHTILAISIIGGYAFSFFNHLLGRAMM